MEEEEWEREQHGKGAGKEEGARRVRWRACAASLRPRDCAAEAR